MVPLVIIKLKNDLFRFKVSYSVIRFLQLQALSENSTVYKYTIEQFLTLLDFINDKDNV